MSPPIREGSGNSIGSIRLGDGSEISEVRTGAGDVLFSAGTDNAVLRWKMDESTGPVTDNISSKSPTSSGNLNNGATLVNDADLVGGRGVDMSGASGYIDGNSGDISFGADHSVFLTVKRSSQFSGRASLFAGGEGSNATHILHESGSIGGLYFDGARGGQNGTPEPTAPYIIRVGYTWNASSKTFTPYLDGSAATANSDPTSIGESTAYHVGTQQGIKNGGDFIADNLTQYDKELSSTEVQDDFNRQPWS